MKAALKYNPAEKMSELKIVHSNKCQQCNRKKKAHNKTRCHCCNQRNYKSRHFDRYTYNALRTNARRRHKAFSLTFDEFVQFCRETGYLEQKGQAPGNYTIDRINREEGYHIGNIRVLTHAENSRKGYYESQGYQDETHWNYEHIEDDPF